MNERQNQLTRTQKAIREGRAYLNTFVGKRGILAYDDETGTAITGTGTGRRSFATTLDQIFVVPISETT
jgi:hypothetical protein